MHANRRSHPLQKAKVVVAVYDAVGGPENPERRDDGYMAGQTKDGRFVIAKCDKHTSAQRYRNWSSVRWGTPLRENNGVLEVKTGKYWERLDKHTPVPEEFVKFYYKLLYPNSTDDLPNTWIFNDFGHATCYYFEDLNKNRKLDPKKEHISGDFVHTTPGDEAKTARGDVIVLEESHGCIHVKPNDIDDMMNKGYLKKGNSIIVHKYSERAPDQPTVYGVAPFEVHFYPLSKKLFVIGTR